MARVNREVRAEHVFITILSTANNSSPQKTFRLTIQCNFYMNVLLDAARAYDDASWFNLFERLGLSFQESRHWMHHYLKLALKNPTSFASVLN